MSTAARKARKRAGVKFTRTPKTPTPRTAKDARFALPNFARMFEYIKERR